MSANVYTTLANAVVYTDKLRVSTGASTVTYQVYAVGLGGAAAEGNLYSAPIQIPANTTRDLYSGAGNRVTVTGSSWTALELGTASSATASIYPPD